MKKSDSPRSLSISGGVSGGIAWAVRAPAAPVLPRRSSRLVPRLLLPRHLLFVRLKSGLTTLAKHFIQNQYFLLIIFLAHNADFLLVLAYPLTPRENFSCARFWFSLVSQQ